MFSPYNYNNPYRRNRPSYPYYPYSCNYRRYPIYYNPYYYPYYPRRCGSRSRIYGMEIAQWNSSKIYLGGNRVMYRGKMYQAKWWTQGNDPSKQVTNPWDTPWKEVSGEQSVEPINPTNSTGPSVPPNDGTGSGYPMWSPSETYVGGDRVVYNGKTYEAKWWTKGFDPSTKVVNPWEIPWKQI